MQKRIEELEKELREFKEDHFGQGWTIKMKLEEEIKRLKELQEIATKFAVFDTLNPNKTENNV